MNKFRIALANLRFPPSPEESVELVLKAVAEAAAEGAQLICFPECYVPGYRGLGKQVPPPDQQFLERAWSRIAAAAGDANVGVILGTERVVDNGLHITALVINRDGTIAGFQDKVQLDPSEDVMYVPGFERRVFETDGVKFGVAICHEGWRYPETVRWPVRQGAQIVFHPHLHEAEPGGYVPSSFADPANTFHEKAILCRAAENTCFVASVNCASEGSPTTSAVVGPEGTLIGHQPYGREGLFVVEIEPALATGLLAKRYKPLEGQ
jgi:predicted amidohydrolase